MDVRSIPLLGGLMEALANYASEGILQRTLVYGTLYVVSVLLAGVIVKGFGWFSLLGVGGTLFIAMLFFGLFLMGVDPENEYTKEDIISMWIVMVVAPAIFYVLLAAAGAAVAQIASPVVLMADAAAGAAAKGVASPAASAIAQYLGNVLMHGGVLFTALSTKYVLTA